MPRKTVDSKLVKKVAANARLSLSDSEIEEFRKDLAGILDAFSELEKARPSAAPSFQPLPVKDVMRDDSPEVSLTQDEALSNAHHTEKGYFKGPKSV